MGMMIIGATITGIAALTTTYTLSGKYESDYRPYCIPAIMLGLSGVIFYTIGGIYG